MYEVRIGDLVRIRCVDLFPFRPIAVKVFRDFAETIACFYSVGLAAGRSRSRAASVDVGEVCCTAARRFRATNVGKGVVAWISHRSSVKTCMLSNGGGAGSVPFMLGDKRGWPRDRQLQNQSREFAAHSTQLAVFKDAFVDGRASKKCRTTA